jgi:hypothetical protein
MYIDENEGIALDVFFTESMKKAMGFWSASRICASNASIRLCNLYYKYVAYYEPF